MNDLGRNYETWDNNQMDLKIMSFNLNVKWKRNGFNCRFRGMCNAWDPTRFSYIRAHYLRWCSAPHQRIFPPVPESTYEGWIRVVGSFRFLPCDLVWLHRFLKWYLCIFSDMSWWLFHVGMPYSMWCVLPRKRSAFCHHPWWCGKRSEWLSVTPYISEELL